MALPQHYLIALVSPFGRLGQFHFALLACAIGFTHLWIYAKQQAMPKDEPWNLFSITLLLLIWCKFCIISRRLHDTGSNGLIAVPVLPLAVFAYLFVIDPKMAGAETVAGWSFFLEHAMSFARTLFIAVFMYCIRAGGQLGPNGYGPEFGDSGDPVVAASVSLDRKRDSTVPQHRYTVVRENDSGWGQRRRPAGFGRR
jgi:uncharacterized membrane protein YhaH (DUF805 family)